MRVVERAGRVQRLRQPDIDASASEVRARRARARNRQSQPGLSDANDAPRRSISGDDAAKNVSITTEAALPELVADDDRHRRRIRALPRGRGASREIVA